MSELTKLQLFDLLEYFTGLANNGYIKLNNSISDPDCNLFDSVEVFRLGSYDLINFYFKNGFPVGFSNVLVMNNYF